MRQLLSAPRIMLLVVSGLLGIVLAAGGRFEPQVQPDTRSYEEVKLDSLQSALSGIRTLGYPLFLRVVGAGGGGYAVIPYLHFVAYVAAVLVFCQALQAVGCSAGAAVAASAVLLLSRVSLEFMQPIGPDALAVSAAIAAMAALLAAVKHRQAISIWIGLGLAVFASYQLRPAYLFLIPLVPVLGMIWARAVFNLPLRSRAAAGLLMALVLVAILPFATFSGMRWFVTGHFGLVSFGGINLIGISGQWLDEDLIPQLSPELQPLAQRMLAHRSSIEPWTEPENFAAMAAMYNSVIWHAAVPAAEELYGADSLRVNQAVGQLAHEILQRRPRQYVRWLFWSSREAVYDLMSLFVNDKGSRLVLLVLLLLQLVAIRKRASCGRLPQALPPSTQRFNEVNILLWLGLGFAAAKLLLVILVEIPIGRYVAPATLWLPSLLALLCWYRVLQVIGPPASESSPLASADLRRR